MMNRTRTRALGAVLALAAMGLAACADFVAVENPDQLEAEAIDAERDRSVLSQSAFQSFVAAYGDLNMHAAWFTMEARVGDTFPTRNEIGRRQISALTNGDNANRWNAIHNTLAYSENTIRAIEQGGEDIDLARLYFTSGYLMLIQADLFCQPTILLSREEPGGALTTVQALDTAVARLTRARTIAAALTGTEATNIATASLVGIARAHLQAGRRTEASAAAAQVSASFVFNLLHMDDPANRARLGNRMWNWSESRISLVVPPEYRAMADAGDTRIAYTDQRRPAQDGVLNFFRQAKIPGWGAPDRLASGLEARYIKVEADRNPADMLALINERRAVGRQSVLAATTDMDALMRELMEQRARDFWLELKKMSDFRRNPNHVPYILEPGENSYYKSGIGPVGNQTCFPVPDAERRNNPKWPGHES
jgi:hypothetical protein